MDYAGSDDELAAVLAHECAHAMYHHVEHLNKKAKKANTAQIIGLLATLLAGAVGGGAAAEAASHLLAASQLVSIATMTGYGKELESEADRVGVQALRHTPFNPVAMMTFMQKLARDERLRGNPDYGIFSDHPYSNERVASIRKQLEDQGIRVDAATQRVASGTFRVEALPARYHGKNVAELRLNGNLLYVVAAGEGDLGALERARKIAALMQDLFSSNLTDNDVRQSPDRQILMMRGIPILQVYSEDAALMEGEKPSTDRAYKEIMRALLKEKLNAVN